MSEANNVWRVEVEGGAHEIEVRHSTLSGKVVVMLDGEEIGEDRMLWREKHVEFDVAGHTAVVDTAFKYGGFAAGSGLHLDGHYVEPLAK